MKHCHDDDNVGLHMYAKFHRVFSQTQVAILLPLCLSEITVNHGVSYCFSLCIMEQAKTTMAVVIKMTFMLFFFPYL